MSFGITAAGWAAISVATTAATTLYSQQQQRRAADDQRRALEQSQADDAAQSAKVESDAAKAANATIAARKQGRRTSALATGAIGTAGVSPLGGSSSPLSAGAPAKPVTALGAGSLS